MKIVQKFLSHGLLIATLVAVFFIYLYRGELFPQWFDKQAQTAETPAQSAVTQTPAVSAEVPKPAQASGAEDEGRAARPVPTEPVAEAVEQAVATQPSSAAAPVAAPAQSEAPTDDVPVVAEQPAADAAQTAGTATAAQYRPVGAEEAAKETYNPVAEVPDKVITAPRYRPLKTKKAAPPPAPATAAAGAAGDAEFHSQLEQARQHYWRHDMQAAEQAYRRLTESHPQRAEVWGELGVSFSKFESIVLDGQIERSWLQGKADRIVQAQREAFQTSFRPSDHLPAWLLRRHDRSKSPELLPMAVHPADQSEIQKMTHSAVRAFLAAGNIGSAMALMASAGDEELARREREAAPAQRPEMARQGLPTGLAQRAAGGALEGSSAGRAACRKDDREDGVDEQPRGERGERRAHPRVFSRPGLTAALAPAAPGRRGSGGPRAPPRGASRARRSSWLPPRTRSRNPRLR